MEFKFTDEQKLKILEIALSTAGPGASAKTISDEMERVAHLLSPGSLAFAAVEGIEARISKVESWRRPFMGTIICVDKEITSNRAVVIFKVAPTQHSPSGQQAFRTGITTYDTPARNLANELAAIGVGQKVRLHVANEKKDDGTGHNVGVLYDVQYRGADPEYDPNIVIDWGAIRIDPTKLLGGGRGMAALVAAQAAQAQQPAYAG